MSLEQTKEYPLSDADIRTILGDDIKITPYPMLKNMKSISECFDKKGRAIILFLTTSPTEGHWCCMLRKRKGIEFFDPYGEIPDSGQKRGMSRSLLESLDESQPDLTALMRASGRPIFYNNHQFQRDSQKVSTCGRHCVARCLYAPYSLEKYANIIKKSNMSPDDFVTGLTYDKLRK